MQTRKPPFQFLGHLLATTVLTGAFASSMVGCVAQSANESSQKERDYQRLILTHGQVYTVNPQQPWAQAVVVEGDEILYVGTNQAALAYENEQSYILNLAGQMVLPGIHDTHLHPLEAAVENFTCVLDETGSINQWLNQLETYLKQDAGTSDEWLLAWGHSLLTLTESQRAPKTLLDSLPTDRPIAIMEATSHSAWVNTKALQLLGIHADSKQPVGGAILKWDDGQPSGILLDNAGDQAFHLALTPTAHTINEAYDSLLMGLESVAANGITSIVDARVYWQRGYQQAWLRAEAEGTLTARTVLSLWAYPDLNDEEQIATLTSFYSNDTNRMLRMNQIKLYSDGITHNTTAALLAPYQEYFTEVGPRGLNYFSESRLGKYVKALGDVGFNMHIHTIGDRGVREALNAIEHNQKSAARHRLTHVEMVSEQDKPRFKQLNVIADFQLAGDFTKPEHHHEMEPLIGQRAYQQLPVKDIYDTGATITLSSDWDVSTLSPFVGMQNSLTRGHQSLPSLDAVIRAYTINGAYTMGQDDVTGSIEVGKKGDFTVIDRNLFEIPVTDIKNTLVTFTIVGGDIVFEQKE